MIITAFFVGMSIWFAFEIDRINNRIYELENKGKPIPDKYTSSGYLIKWSDLTASQKEKIAETLETIVVPKMHGLTPEQEEDYIIRFAGVPKA